MRTLIAAALLASACTQALPDPPSASGLVYDWSGEPSERAIERWESVRAKVSPACAEQVRATPITWVDPARVPALCGPDALACYLPQGEIIVPTDAYQRNVVHEFMHALSSCEMHGTDPDHTMLAVWVGLMCDGTPGSCPTGLAAR